MSNHLWNLVKKELRELLTPSSLVSVIVVVMLFVAMGSFLGGETKEVTSAKHIGYLDLSDAPDPGDVDYSHLGLEALRDYYQNVLKVNPDEYVVHLCHVTAEYGTEEFDSQLYDAMTHEVVDTAIIFKKDFDRNLNGTPEIKNGDIAVYWNQTGLGIFSSIGMVTSDTAISVMNSAISDKMLEGAIPDEKERAVALMPIPSTMASPHTTFLDGKPLGYTPDQIYSAMNQQTMFVPIIIMLIIVMIGSIVISSMGNEKENKTLETLLTLPVNRTAIVAGKLIGSTIAGLVMGALYMVGMYFYISGLSISGSGGVTMQDLGLSLSFLDWVIVAAFMFLSITCALGLCMILGAIAKNYKAAQMYIMPISILAVIPMFVTMFSSIEALPGFAQGLMFAIPFTHPMTIMQNLMFGNTTWIIGGAIYLLAFAAVTFYATVKIYNSDILITGLSFKKKKGKGADGDNEDIIQ